MTVRAGAAALVLLLAAAARAAEPRPPAVVAAEIDRHVQARLDREKVPASPRCSDAEFVRRAYLDLTGRVPTADQARAFLDSKDPARRAKLVDELLARPEYGENFGHVWRHLLVPPDADVRAVGHSLLLGRLLADRFNTGAGWDAVVRRLLAEPGGTAVRWTAPEQVSGPRLAAVVAGGKANVAVANQARLFLGVKLTCAECHDARSQPWRQDDYWGLVAAWAGRPGVAVPDNGESKRVGETIPSRLLDGQPGPAAAAKGGKAAGGGKGKPNLRGTAAADAFTAWATAADNPYFTGNAANRWWHHLMGRGLVEPLGDGHGNNPPSHPEVLDLLRAELVAAKLDLRHLVRCVCNSETYQRGGPVPGNAADRTLFAHHPPRPLTADQLYDSLRVATGWPEIDLEPLSPRFTLGAAEGRPKVAGRDRFVNFFANAKTQDDAPTDYRRGVPQALTALNTALNRESPTAGRLRKANLSPDEVVEEVVLGTLSRRPTAAEARALRAYLGPPADAGNKYPGLLWVLLNSSEFHVNR